MSTDWNIRCVDCNEIHTFTDANHEDQLMLFLIKHRAAIAGLHAMFEDARVNPHFRYYQGALVLDTAYGDVEPAFFHAHKTHRLVPHSEYGHDIECPWPDQCTCPNLGARTR